MTSERWRKFEELYHAARQRDPSERSAFLADACSADDELRCNIESLLAQDPADNILNTPPVDILVGNTKALSPGDKLGPYEILAPIGAGGMGEVYKARDTRLNRIVAIKVSRIEFSERFEREARAVATLNHPNICALYDVGPNYLVMEYVEGAPVAPVDNPRKLLDIAVQISEGLAAAHAAGIVHRDLKPDNILINREGRIKILDFGLAKAVARGISPEDHTRTIEHSLTGSGMILGSVPYMSPEQARGTNLTAQSDQFSLGLVLYELASGKRAFRRGSATETMTAIIREDAEPLPATVPAPLRWIIERLLAKEPAERYDSTRDLYRELRQAHDRLAETATASAIPVESTIRRAFPRNALAIGVAAGLALGLGLAAMLIRPAPVDLSRYKFTAIARDEATKNSPAWSPDGKSIAYVADIHGVSQVFTRALGAPGAAQLTHATDSCVTPFWSTDGATVYYSFVGDLWSVGASGGTPELVMREAGWEPSLHPDGKTLAFIRDGHIWIGSLKGGAPRQLEQSPPGLQSTPDRSRAASLLKLSPDGSRLAVVAPGGLWIVPFPSGAPRNLGPVGARFVSWFPDNRHLVIGSRDEMSLVTLVDTKEGSRRVIYRGTDPILGASVSPNGRKIAYNGGPMAWDIVEISVPEGRVHAMARVGMWSLQPEWAPSGTHFLVSTTDSFDGSRSIEDRSAAEGFSRRVVDQPPGSSHWAAAPRWAPDGTRFLFLQRSPQRKQLAISSASGGGIVVLAELNSVEAHAWSPDGQWVLFTRLAGGKQQLLKMRPVAGATPVVLANAAPAATTYSMIQWSPAGDWIVYPSAAGMSMISPDGNTARQLTARKLLTFAFSNDGAQVYGIVRNAAGGAEWQLYSIDVRSGADKLVAPLDLPASTNGIAGFSLHPDGKRFLTSIAKWPYDIWMLEGFDPPGQQTWLGGLLER